MSDAFKEGAMTTRISVLINDECAAVAREAMEQRDISPTEFVQQAISAYKFLHDMAADGRIIDDRTPDSARASSNFHTNYNTGQRCECKGDDEDE